LIANTANATHLVSQTGLSSSVSVLSFYAKAAEETVISGWLGGASVGASFNLTTGVATSQGATSFGMYPVGNSWYRCWVYWTTTTTTAHIYMRTGGGFTGNGTSGLYLWGAQLEAGAFLTSYIPNLATGTTTRNADAVSMTGTNFSDWYNASEGTFALSGSIFVNQGATTVNFLQVSNGVSNSVAMVLGMFDLTGPLWQVLNTTTSANLDLGTLTLNTVFNMAGTYKVDSFAGALNGGTVQTDSTGTIPTVSQMGIGNRLSGPYMNGHVRKIQYWPQRLTNAEVQAFSK
jgi:hypothetical protein